VLAAFHAWSVRTGLVGARLLLKPLADAFEPAVPLLILAALHEKILERVRHGGGAEAPR
jgi:hypothetical protein